MVCHPMLPAPSMHQSHFLKKQKKHYLIRCNVKVFITFAPLNKCS